MPNQHSGKTHSPPGPVRVTEKAIHATARQLCYFYNRDWRYDPAERTHRHWYEKAKAALVAALPHLKGGAVSEPTGDLTIRVTDEAMEAALEGYRQASHGCNAIPEWIRGALEAALPHEFVGTEPVSVQPNPAQTSEVEVVAREMRDYTDHHVRVAERPCQRTLDAWADRLDAALPHLTSPEKGEG